MFNGIIAQEETSIMDYTGIIAVVLALLAIGSVFVAFKIYDKENPITRLRSGFFAGLAALLVMAALWLGLAAF